MFTRLARPLAWAADHYRPPGPNTRARPANVAVVCNSFLRYGCEQAIGLAEAGASVTLYYVDRLDDFGGIEAERDRYLDRVVAAGITTVVIPRRRLARIPRDIRSLHRSIRARGRPTLIVHAHVDPRLVFLGLRFQTALFVHDPAPHSGDHESQFPWPLRAIARFSEVTAARILVHSPSLAQQLSPWFDQSRVAVVPHGVAVSVEPAALISPPRLLIVGRLMHYKGVDTALEAFSRVRAERPECELVIAGRGDLAATVRARDGEGIELINRYITEDEITALLRSARLVLLPYRDASQSGVGLLATGMGIPCVVSRTGALPDLVPLGHSPLVVAPSDPDELASAVLGALDHGDDFRAETLHHAAATFAWPVVGQQLISELVSDGCSSQTPGGTRVRRGTRRETRP